MPNAPPLSHLLKDIDIEAEASQFTVIMNHTLNRSTTSTIPIPNTRTPRKPQKKNQFIPSAFRPHVLASERLQRWISPHSIVFHQSIQGALPQSNLSHLFEVMTFSLDQGTCNGYGAGLLRFTQFCDKAKVPEKERMPASELLLSAFIADAAGTVGPSAINNWLAGLHFWHIINAAQWNGDEMLSQTKKGAQKLTPITSKHAKRPPVTIEHLYALRSGLDLTNSFDAAIWAIACIAFWSCCRLGELVIPSTNTFDPLKHVDQSEKPIFSTASNGTEFATFHIPWTKTTLQEGADISVTAHPQDPSCPIAALRHHISCNTKLPSSAPMFTFETANGGWSPMTKSWFMSRCNEVWIAAGLPDMPGHGFRIGGATHLLLMGTPPDIVAVQGRWKSRAFLEYWRRIESILPLFISSAGSSNRISLIFDSMSSYQKKWRLK